MTQDIFGVSCFLGMKTLLVLGGTGGIGSAICAVLARAGMRPYALYAHNEARAAALQRAVPSCVVARCDVRDRQRVQQHIDRLVRDGGTIGGVVNTLTTPLSLQPFDRLNADVLDEDLNVMLCGSANVYRAIIPHLKRVKGGVLVTLLTAAVTQTPPPARMSSYVSAKYGLLGLMRCLAGELGSFGIRVVSISPSFVETELLHAFPKKLLALERAKRPDGAFLSPDDVAAVVCDAIGNAERYPNGSEFVLRIRGNAIRV